MGATDPRPLVVHVVYRFDTGGLENGIVNLINHMPEQHFRHAVLALTEVTSFRERIRRKDVVFHGLQKSPGQGLWHYPRVFQLFREWRPSLVHTRNLGTLEFQVPAWAAGVPGRVHGEHGRDADDVNGLNKTHIRLRKAYRPFVQHQIALGSELALYLRERVGVPAKNLTPISNGVDHLRFAPAASRATVPGCPFTDPHLWLVGTVGRMQTVKAQPLLARAFVDALRQAPALQGTLRLVMVGDGPLRAECETILREAGVAHLAWLPGERSDVPDVMRGLNCFVLPSLVEGISNTILEAMSCGLPVLATTVGGNADLVEHGVTGLLVPAGDVGSLCAGLVQMAREPVRAAAFGAAGRRVIEQRFSMPAMVAAYQAVYDRVLRRGAKE